MESEKLFELIRRVYLYDLRDKIEKKDEYGFGKKFSEKKSELEALLNEEQKKQLSHFQLALENKIDQEYYEVQIFLTNYAFRLGMEMQRAFDAEDFQ
ncbi:MAG: hypothetical protein K2J11_06965 [Oscillospiraceae bacterium]|nr:hypothetical protein [Oscillospiraceae bacterium]